MSKLIGKSKNLIIIVIFILAIVLFLYIQNNYIVITNIEYHNTKVPFSFDGYKILHISDLHNKEFGNNQSTLIEKTKKVKPNIIVITGDLIDGNRPNIDTAIKYLNEVIKIAPVYFVPGNHERWSGLYSDLSQKLTETGVTILNNESTSLNKGDDTITLAGVQDPSFITKSTKNYSKSDLFENEIRDLVDKSNANLTILLSHRPEKISTYANQHVDLVFAGHAHGGQFRIPFISGLVAPDQGFFPKYTSGIYIKDNTSMIVSRGLGNSTIPIRIFNRPEIVVATLKHK